MLLSSKVQLRVEPILVVVLLKVPWERADGKLPFALRLVDADGRPVLIDGNPIGIRKELGLGRRSGVPAGVPIDASFNLNLGPMPLPPGRYRWLLEIGEEVASAGFTVLPKQG